MKKWVLRFRAVDRDKYMTVVDGTKSVETRAAGGRFDAIAVGDILVFTCEGERLERQVKSVRHFASIAELFAAIPRPTVMPWTKTDEEAVASYYSFPGYKEKIAERGLLAFEMEKA